MKKKVVKLTLLVLLAFVISSFTIVLIEKRITEEEKVKLVEEWFSSPYEYMFEITEYNSSGSMLTFLVDGEYQFMAGINGILYYGGIISSIREVFSYSDYSGFTDYTAIEKLSGIKCFTKTEYEDNTAFNYLNPEIIGWGYEQLPSPKLKIQEYTCQKIYESVFSRFFRMMTEAYIYVNIDNDTDKLRKEYKKKMYNSDYQGLSIIEELYEGALPQYYVPRDGTYMTTAMAIAFWIRRDIDGSSDELWNKLQKFMKTYDKKWLKKIK